MRNIHEHNKAGYLTVWLTPMSYLDKWEEKSWGRRLEEPAWTRRLFLTAVGLYLCWLVDNG